MAKLLIINETDKKKPQIQRILKSIQAKFYPSRTNARKNYIHKVKKYNALIFSFRIIINLIIGRIELIFK